MSKQTFEIIIGVLSVAMFVGSLAAIPTLVRRMPADYFVRPPPKHSMPVKLARNVGGFLLIAAGIAMLVLPGQGIVTLIIGLSILDLPIRHKALSWLLQRKKIQEGVQRLRSKVGKPPFVVPQPA